MAKMSVKLRSKILKSFQISGYTLRSEASKFLLGALEPLEEERQELWLRRVLGWLQTQRLEGPFLTKDDLLSCIREFERVDNDGTDVRLLVVDAFALAPLTYCQERRKFVPRKVAGHSTPPRLFGDAGAKAFFFRERYQLVLQKTARHHCFSSRTRLPGATGFDLRPVEHLLGTTGDRVVVLGMICQLEEGKYFLEDMTGFVRIDISGTKFTADLFMENSFVLAEGHYDDMVFHVDAMGLPPIEEATETLKYMAGVSIFDKFPEKSRIQLELSEVPDNALFVLLSDVWLDQPKVLSHLRVLFAGFAQGPPACFVLAGNFLSRSTGLQRDRALLREGFKALADLLGEFPLLVKHSRFIFVPGPSDPGLSNVLPRPGLPCQVTEPLRPREGDTESGGAAASALAERCHWASNPCRLLYCGREVVLWRQDGLAKACRNAVHRPWDRTGIDLAQMYTRSLAANAHLSPLSPTVTPVYWEWDFALWLHPLPDAVVCFDACDAFTVEHAGCTFFNPGSFPKTEYAFRVYYPASKKVEDSQIGNTAE